MALNDLNNQEFSLGGIEPQQPTSPSLLQSGLRNLLRTDVNVLESLFGLPGDVASGVLNLANIGIGGLTGYQPLPSEIKVLPTSKDIREKIVQPISQFLPEGYLEPQTPTEATLDEYIQDATSFLHPFFGAPQVAVGLISPAVGQLAKYGAKKIGLGEAGQQGVKLGSMFLTAIGGAPKLRERATQMYKRAEELLPEGVSLKITPATDNTINEMIQRTVRGDKTPSKTFLNDRLKYLESVINPKTNTIPVEEAYQFTRDINEFFANRDIPKGIEGLMGKLLDNMKDVVRSAKKEHPEFVKNFTESSEIWKTLHTSSRANDYIQSILNKISKKFTSPLTSYFFGLPKAIAGAAAGATLGLTSDVVDKAMRSPAVLKQYGKIIGEALEREAGPLSKSLIKFDKTISKELSDKEFTYGGIEDSPQNEFTYGGIER